MVERSFELSAPVQLVVQAAAGEVELSTGEGPATVEVEPLNDAARELLGDVRVELKERARGSELVVEMPSKRLSFGFRSPEFRIAAHVPDDSDLRLTVASADVEAHGRWSVVELRSSSGDLRFDASATELEVQSASGDVELGPVGGPVVARTASGDVTVEKADGSLTADLASGDLRVGEAGGSVHANSASGDLVVESVSAGSVELRSASGDIVVGIRRGARVWIDAESASGSTSSDLELSDEEPGGEGELVELRARSASGDIRIARAG